MTGLYPNSTGIHQNQPDLPPDDSQAAQSLPQAFRLDGYFAGRIGKLYHYNVPKSVGTNGHDDPGSWELELNPAGCDRLIEEPDIFSLRPEQLRRNAQLVRPLPVATAEHTDGMLAT